MNLKHKTENYYFVYVITSYMGYQFLLLRQSLPGTSFKHFLNSIYSPLLNVRLFLLSLLLSLFSRLVLLLGSLSLTSKFLLPDQNVHYHILLRSLKEFLSPSLVRLPCRIHAHPNAHQLLWSLVPHLDAKIPASTSFILPLLPSPLEPPELYTSLM